MSRYGSAMKPTDGGETSKTCNSKTTPGTRAPSRTNGLFVQAMAAFYPLSGARLQDYASSELLWTSTWFDFVRVYRNSRASRSPTTIATGMGQRWSWRRATSSEVRAPLSVRQGTLILQGRLAR